MTKAAFETQVRHITDTLGDPAVRFFTTIGNMAEFFQQADRAVEASPITVREFERTAGRTVALAGVDETAQTANCEYLLKLIDKTNHNTTAYGTSSYATTQAVDKTAVDSAVQQLRKPAGKFVAVACNGLPDRSECSVSMRC